MALAKGAPWPASGFIQTCPGALRLRSPPLNFKRGPGVLCTQLPAERQHGRSGLEGHRGAAGGLSRALAAGTERRQLALTWSRLCGFHRVLVFPWSPAQTPKTGLRGQPDRPPLVGGNTLRGRRASCSEPENKAELGAAAGGGSGPAPLCVESGPGFQLVVKVTRVMWLPGTLTRG